MLLEYEGRESLLVHPGKDKRCLSIFSTSWSTGGHTLEHIRVIQIQKRFNLVVRDLIIEFIPYLIKEYEAGRFPFDRFITFYNVADIDKACKDVHSGKAIKAVILWS